MNTASKRESVASQANQSGARPIAGGNAQVLRWWQPAIIVGATLAAYATSLRGAFVFDDIRHIVENQDIRDLSDLGRILSAPRPVVELSLAANYAMGGLNPIGYHIFNVAVHALGALLLFGLIRRTLLLNSAAEWLRERAGGIAAVCAIVWSAHPLTTQAVTYTIQRGESMMAMFYLLTLYCFVRGSTGKRPVLWFAGAVAAVVVGMGCKGVIVTAPLLALLYDRSFLSGSFVRAIRARWAIHGAMFASVAFIAAAGIGQQVFAAPDASKVYKPAAGFGVEGVSWMEYALTQPGVILHYLRLSVAPVGLVLDYRWPSIERIEPMDWLAFGVVGALGLASLVGLVRNRWWGFVGAAFFVVLAPTSSIIPIRDAAFEHRMYLPLAALVTLVVAGAFGLALRRGEWNETGKRRFRVVCGIFGVVALVFGGLTAARNLDYSSELRMWQDVFSKRPHNDRALINVIAAMPDDATPDEEVIDILRRALAIQPNHADARFRLGFALLSLDREQEAFVEIDRALQSGQATAQTWLRWGQVLAERRLDDRARAAFRRAQQLAPSNQRVADELARLDASINPATASVDQLRDFAARNPDRYEDQLNLGLKLNDLRRYSEAIAPLERACSIRRGAPALFALGFSYQKSDRVAEAEELYREALRLAPASLEISINLANLLEERRDPEGAIEVLQAATEVTEPAPAKSLRARVYFNLGNILARQRRLTESIEAYLEAVDLDPNNAAAFYGLGWSFYNAQMLDDAIAALRRSVELNSEDDRAQALLLQVFQERGQMPQANDPIPDWESRRPKHETDQP